MGYLSGSAPAGSFELLGQMQALQQQGGPGIVRQTFDLMALGLRPGQVRPEEYYTYALWRSDRGRAFLRGFLANRRIRAFNSSLLMPARGLDCTLGRDKIATEATLTARGLPLTRSRAVFLSDYRQKPDTAVMRDLQVLRTQNDLVAFLSDPAIYPIFGKPRTDSFARGAAVFAGLAEPGVLRFMDGRIAPLAGLATEIAADWVGGYMFQPFYRSAAALARHTGPAMASVRIVTLLTDRGVEPWYGVIRLPASTAMHDGDAAGQRIWGLIDVATGKIIKLRDLRDPMIPDLTHGQDPEVPFLGMALPHWDQAVAICRLAHESFTGNGIIGWDVFLTEEGALLNEGNANPGHVYQVAAQRPLLNPDMRPAYDRALAFARKHGGGKRAF